MQTRAKVVLGALLAAFIPSLMIGCTPHAADPTGASRDDVGSVGVALEIAPGIDLPSATYLVTGPGGVTKSGALELRGSTRLTATIGGLPAGSGYTIVITGTATGGIGCSGSAPFSLMARATTTLVVNVQCQDVSHNGSVHVTGVIGACPVVDELSATPAEVRVGSSLALAAGGHDLDGQPLTFLWSAPSGTFSGTSVAAPSFTCTVVGEVVVSVTVSDGTCSDTMSTTVTCSPAAVLDVFATVETDPVGHAGDAADDPAIWVNPLDAALSTIIGTDKTAGGGLGVYGLDGHQLQLVTAGALNNVDLRGGFPLGGHSVSLVTAGNRTDNSIAMFAIDPVTRLLSDVAARKITTLATYGSCMYHSPVTGKLYYFVDSKAGDIEQWELFDDGTGHVDATKIRNLHKLGTQPEACVVDDELGFFYIGEEDVGIWKYAAEPTVDPSSPLANGVLVDGANPGGHLVADVEGLAIARTGAGTGYLLAANQGDSTYAMYTREGANTYVKTFRVGSSLACGIDEVTGSDGIDVTTASLGPAFPQGVFVTQDDTNGPTGNQNFKLVPWQDILNGPGASAPVCQPGGGSDGGVSEPDAGSSSDASTPPTEGGPAGNPAEFCAAFCGKCNTCWNPAGGFSEGDCLYQLKKPSFSLDDCLAGCALGLTPAFPISNLVPEWQSLECLAFDEGM